MMKAITRDSLSLKWGTLKAWDFTHNDKAADLARQWELLGSCMSAACQRDTPEQIDIICQIIDAVDCDIYLDWDGKYVSKDEAKKYVRDYKR